MDSTIQVYMAKGSRNHHQLSRSGPLVGRDASWWCRIGSRRVAPPYAHRDTAGSHNDGNDAAPTRSQTQNRLSGAPHADGKGQGSSQGALRGPQCESIDLYNRSIDSARCEETCLAGGRGVNRGRGMDWDRCDIAEGVA